MFARSWIHLLWLALAFGCGDDCHDVACSSTLIVELAPQDGFEDGSYEVTLDAPDGSKLCTFELDGGAVTSSSCVPEDLSVDGAELPRYVLIRHLDDLPETVTVALARDGAELAREDFTPEYEEVWPDPNACGGPCRAAQVSLGF